MDWLSSFFYSCSNISSYKTEKSLDERINVSAKYLTKFPNKVPAIVNYTGSLELRNDLNRVQLVSRDMLATRFVEIVKEHYFTKKDKDKIKDTQFILSINENRRDTKTDRTFQYLYNKFKDEDGFLYVKISS